ncbi:hypothetical protein PHYSODRAFT_338280 [Phytophthora sojae]|uniref:Uncharacterized protein n=1 Tax=Phytophthora sojae (strain P6497) TaxID=1094619 RepID=G5A441_PHYSP|nr:hypothetical protein PHYSODRAFT_338280 [Phytophthora sojae]EGZ09487.1 hypothetical protein PHYSODRAFT_338280 [Phytophthora sojae]|eukprot:XP_009534348.1 hypothetical protein PHYSODRAFT_338280 [Phytophthora sojae]
MAADWILGQQSRSFQALLAAGPLAAGLRVLLGPVCCWALCAAVPRVLQCRLCCWGLCAAGPSALLGRLCCWAVCAAGPCVLLTPGHLLLGYVRCWDVFWVAPVRSRGV